MKHGDRVLCRIIIYRSLVTPEVCHLVTRVSKYGILFIALLLYEPVRCHVAIMCVLVFTLTTMYHHGVASTHIMEQI